MKNGINGKTEISYTWTEEIMCHMWWDQAHRRATGRTTGRITQTDSGPKSVRYSTVPNQLRWELTSTSIVISRTSSCQRASPATRTLSKSMMARGKVGEKSKRMLWWFGWSHTRTPLSIHFEHKENLKH